MSENGPQFKEVELNEVAAKALQRGSFSASERLLASYLIEGITGDPLESVIFSLRAGMLLDEDSKNKLGISSTEVESLYTVAQRLNKSMGEGVEEFNINLKTLSWETDLKPWVKMAAYEHFYDDEEFEPEEEPSEEEEFKTSTLRLTPSGFEHLKADFLRYATPRAQRIGSLIAATINPATYAETLQIFKSPRRDSR